jgi:hypothetical protein
MITVKFTAKQLEMLAGCVKNDISRLKDFRSATTNMHYNRLLNKIKKAK